MFENLEQIPEPIRDFYEVITVSEQQFNEDGTPQLVKEEYTYLDENGVEQTGTRLVPVYLDVEKVIMKPRPETKSWADVEQINTHQNGKNYDLVQRFAEMANEGTRWNFHAEYLLHLEYRQTVADQRPVLSGEADDPNTTENEMWVNGFTPSDYQAKLDEIDAQAPTMPELVNVMLWMDTHFTPLEQRQQKLAGVEFEGVMCSATKEDQWGLASVLPIIQSSQQALNFEFSNGSRLLLTAGNLDAFLSVWTPFRQSFFPNAFTKPVTKAA